MNYFKNLIFLCVLLIFSCGRKENYKVVLESDLNFGFEKVWNSSIFSPWIIMNHYNENRLDSLNQFSGKFCFRLTTNGKNNRIGLAYGADLPLPDVVDTVTISCKLKKEVIGNDDFYFVAYSKDIPDKEDNIICYEILNVESHKGWQDYEIQFKNNSKLKTFFFGIVSIDSVHFLVDEFEVNYDNISIKDFPFYTSENIELLNKYTHPISNKALKEEVDDLIFLTDIVKDKTVIGLGESNHGTHEIFSIKNRIIKYLVEHEGFNTIVFESNMDNLHHVNEYVTNENCKMSIDSVMSQFIHVFQSEEIKSLVNWLKQFNRGKSINEKVYFLGCDMQDDIQSIHYLKSFAEMNDDALLDLILAYEEEYKVYENLEIIKQIQKYIKKNKKIYDVDEIQFKRLEHSSFLLEQFAIYDANLGNRSIHRDSSMANNLLWVLNSYENRKAIFWADKYHTIKDISTSAGGFIEKALKEKYYVIAFHLSKGFAAGKFSTSSILNPRLIPSKPQFYLNAASDSIFFLDAKEFCGEFLNQSRKIESMEEMCKMHNYDGIVHIKKASPALRN